MCLGGQVCKISICRMDGGGPESDAASLILISRPNSSVRVGEGRIDECTAQKCFKARLARQREREAERERLVAPYLAGAIH